MDYYIHYRGFAHKFDWGNSYCFLPICWFELRSSCYYPLYVLHVTNHVWFHDVNFAYKVYRKFRINSDFHNTYSTYNVNLPQSAVIWGLTVACIMAIIVQLVYSEWNIWSWIFGVCSAASFACCFNLVFASIKICFYVMQKIPFFS